MRNFKFSAILLLGIGFLAGCSKLSDGPPQPRLTLFIGVDVSGSFLKGPDFDKSLDFLSRYLYGHLKGLGGLEVPKDLFLGSIGGAKAKDPKTFFPIETFQGKSPEEIRAKLAEIFPKTKEDAYTDYNAFFAKVAEVIQDRKLVLKPVAVVMISDGRLDAPGKKKKDFKSIDLKPLERLSRNITLRLLFTDPETGGKWQNLVPRKRVKIWAQDSIVLATSEDPQILIPDKPLEEQAKYWDWVLHNVDFNVRAKRVD